MSMETLNVIQFIQLSLGYLGFTVGLPALVFYRKAKRFPAAVRFLIYFTIGNFYVINLVQILELLHISYRITLFLFTFVPAILLSVKFYQIPLISYVKTLLGECRHYLLRELGFKSFVRHRWRELKVFLRVVGRNIWRLLRENIRKAGKEEPWVHRALLRQGYRQESQVLLALWDGGEKLTVFPMDPPSRA